MRPPADLALACRAELPMAVGNVVKVAPSSRSRIDRAHVLDEYLKALEDERRKIEAFKRELPHCMQLLEYAIEASKENAVHSPPSCSPGHPIVSILGKTTKTLGLFGKDMVQEFLKGRPETVRKEDSEEDEKEKARRSSSSVDGDRPTWMAEAQLWSQPSLGSDHWKEKESSTEDSVRRKKDSAEKSTLTSPALLFNAKQRPGGAFTPFVKEKPVPSPIFRAKAGVADLMLSSGESRPTTTPNVVAVESEVGSVEVSPRTRDVDVAISQGTETGGRLNVGGSSYSGGTGSTTSGGGAQRKARRCWSPELHRRFVSALQQLGGSQIATPKQIRELMKVDGLTNDEVKSHLQIDSDLEPEGYMKDVEQAFASHPTSLRGLPEKYRLHTRRPSPTPQGAQQQTPPQLVVLGGIWVPPEYGNVAMYHDPSSSVSQAEPMFCQPSISQEFYSQLHPSVQIELHRSPSRSSPHGPLQSTSNLSSGARQTSGEVYNREDSAGEDGKSESSSWKGENNSRESSKKEELDRQLGDDTKDEDDTDTDEADNGRDGQVRLQLEMSCSSVHDIKTEPPLA